MFGDDSVQRRTVLKRVGTAAVASATLAGCGGGTNDGGGGGNENENTDTPTETPTEKQDTGGGSNPSFGGWMSDANNYTGVVDKTGKDTVTVKVGAGNGLAFGPAAVRVSTGTKVVWKWTGQGGQHNVVEKDKAFKSELASEEGHTFSHTFESAGTVKYYCNPHKMLGMKGVVVVE